jgi:hypothetical protein
MIRSLQLLAILSSCALSSACGDYSGGATTSTGQTVLVAGTSGLSSGEQVTAFASTAYPLLRDNCNECHSGLGPGTPHIASVDPSAAYSAVVDNQKVNFTLPDSSRIVRRLATDFHYCWSSCVVDGATMLVAVNAWKTLMEDAGVSGGGPDVDVETLASDSLLLDEGEEEEGDERFEQDIIALYEFKEGSGPTAFDTSGVAPAMDLSLTGTTWMDSYGIQIADGGIAIADEDDSRKLYERIAEPGVGSGAYSVEAWVIPGNITQTGESGPARIITYSRGTGSSNFTLGQHLYQYFYRNRNVAEGISSRGTPALVTYAEDQDLQDTLQHVVITFDRLTGRRIYVDGVWTDDLEEQEIGRLWNWDDRSQLALGNEISGVGNEWLGAVRFLAIFDRALTPNQIQQNYLAGVGKRITLSFDVSEWAGVGTFLDFSVTQLDLSSYLFCQPTFRGPGSVGLSVQNVRIQVNDTVPVEGQAFSTVDDTMLADGQQVSRLCSVIRTELGPTSDSFKIVFEELGRFQSPLTPVTPGYVVSTAVLDPVPGLGFRDFGRVNASMSALTGVDPNLPDVLSTYNELEQQLPGTSDLRSFVSANQVGVSKLAFEYCHEMVEGDTGLRDAFFGAGFEFDQVPAVAFGDPAKIDLITEPLITRMLRYGSDQQELADQADSAQVEAHLDALIAELMVCNLTPCDAARTVNIVKGVCTAVLASAGVMVH